MEQIASGTEAAAVDHDFSSPAENIFVPVGILTDDCFFVMCRESWSSSSGSNTNATVTVELIPDDVPSLILSSCRLSSSVLLRSVLWHCWIDTKKSI